MLFNFGIVVCLCISDIIDNICIVKCVYYWPEDGRSYVALGKILGKQSKANEARAVYEKGCQATQGENPYIWQVFFYLFNSRNSKNYI